MNEVKYVLKDTKTLNLLVDLDNNPTLFDSREEAEEVMDTFNKEGGNYEVYFEHTT